MLHSVRIVFGRKAAVQLHCVDRSRALLIVTSQPVLSSQQIRRYTPQSNRISFMPIAKPSFSPITRLNRINKHFSTASKMSQTNNADFELQNLFGVKGKVSFDSIRSICVGGV